MTAWRRLALASLVTTCTPPPHRGALAPSPAVRDGSAAAGRVRLPTGEFVRGRAAFSNDGFRCAYGAAE